MPAITASFAVGLMQRMKILVVQAPRKTSQRKRDAEDVERKGNRRGSLMPRSDLIPLLLKTYFARRRKRREVLPTDGLVVGTEKKFFQISLGWQNIMAENLNYHSMLRTSDVEVSHEANNYVL